VSETNSASETKSAAETTAHERQTAFTQMMEIALPLAQI